MTAFGDNMDGRLFMAIYGFGAYYGYDVSKDFLKNDVVGTGWSQNDAPEIHEFIKTLKVGDIVYIKSFSPASSNLFIKGIGIICDYSIVSNGIVACGRNVVWKDKITFSIPKPVEKNNVRLNTMYEEFNQIVQKEILARI